MRSHCKRVTHDMAGKNSTTSRRGDLLEIWQSLVLSTGHDGVLGQVSWQDVAAVRDGRGPDVADAQLVWIRRRAVCRSGQAQQAPAAGECADQSHLGGVPHRQPGTRQLPCVTGESV